MIFLEESARLFVPVMISPMQIQNRNSGGGWYWYVNFSSPQVVQRSPDAAEMPTQ